MPIAPEIATLVSALPTPYLLLSPALTIEAVSEAYLQATFTQRERVLGHYLFDVFPENSPTLAAQGMHNLRASLQHVLTTGQPQEMTLQHYGIPDPDRAGQFVERYWQSVNAPVLDAQGQVVQLLHSVRDATAEVQAQARLRESQAAEQAAHAVAEQQRQRFREVLTQMPAYIAVYQGPEHIYQFVNPPYQNLFPHRSFLGRPFREGTPEAVELGVVALFDQVYQTGEPVYLREMEGWFDFHGNGQPVQVFLNISLHPLRNVQGHIDGVLDFTYDVSEQVRARQQVEQLNQELETRVHERIRELSEQRQLLSRILAQVPASIATLTGPEHRYSFFNEPYLRLTAGRTALGYTVAEILPEIVDQGFVGFLDRVYATGEPFVGRDMPAQLYDAKTGQPEPIYIDFVYQPLFDQAKQVQGILAFILDVTDKVQARQQVQHLNEELAAINEELQVTNEELLDSNTQLLRTNTDLDTFVYAASHDLKAPIANIEGLLDALREYLPTHEQEPMVPRLVDMIEGAIRRFQQTVAHLTDVTRLQYGSEPMTGDADVPGILDDVRLDVLPLLESTRAQLQFSVPACPGVRIPVKHLRSILFNLLSNALKYRAPDRTPLVQVRAQCTASRFVLEVQDNGLGLSEAQQEQLFTMFRRLHAHVEGSGVGLYLIKRMIELAGGSIAVASQPGVGSTFTVTLPRT